MTDGPQEGKGDSFWNRLRRRKVVQWGIAYAAGAWGFLQGLEYVSSLLEWPAELQKLTGLALLIGLPIVLVLAWYHGDRGEQRVSRTELAILTLLFLLGGGLFWRYQHTTESPTVAVTATSTTSPTAAIPVDSGPSIAVLPFVNMSTDAENGFFADGISEELLNVLAGVDGLKVASRTSAFSFKGKDTPIPEIARQLGVAHVLEGSVRKQGQRVRITAQLIKAGTDEHLWSETYDRDLTDIFKVQEEIAQAITNELQGILGKRQVAVAASTDNLDAYQGFFRGRARFHSRNDLLAAIDDLSSAVNQDPDFAEAWIYLAAAWFVAPGYHSEDEVKAAKAKAESRAALKRAEALAPEHPMVLAIRGQFLEAEGDLIGALEVLEASAASSTQDSNPIMWRGGLLLRSGYINEAIADLESAQNQDPLAGINNGYLAFAYLSAGQNQKAEASARKAWSQGWDIAIPVIVFDMAARGERERAVALWDEFLTPIVPAEAAERNAALKELLNNPESKALDAMNIDPVSENIEFGIANNRFDRMLDLAERDLKQEYDDQQWWLRSAWLPSTLDLREQPRFFALAENLGMVRMWETRGYPDGCKRVKAIGGDHLDCVGVNRR